MREVRRSAAIALLLSGRRGRGRRGGGGGGGGGALAGGLPRLGALPRLLAALPRLRGLALLQGELEGELPDLRGDQLLVLLRALARGVALPLEVLREVRVGLQVLEEQGDVREVVGAGQALRRQLAAAAPLRPGVRREL